MRAANGVSVAVRRPSGEIVVRERFHRALGERFPWLRWPLLRGVVVLFETVVMGLDALDFSAKQAEPASAAPASPPPSSWGTGLTLGLAVLFALALFVALPHVLSVLVGKAFGGLALTSPLFHLVTGGFKLLIFIAYLGLLSLLPDVRRVFMYHGAEHKVIATYEAREPLDVAHARQHTTFHARCGTSFLLVVVVASIFVFAILLPLVGLGEGVASHVKAILIKVPLLLPIAALAYEANRFAADHLGNAAVRLLVTPGFWLQRLTTREPEDSMLEVAIASLATALRRNEAGAAGEASRVVVYRGFAEVPSRPG